ncbi:MAG: iron-containing redox enzyme family protein [Burkholderiaceae bacterium]
MQTATLPFFVDLVARTDEARRAFETNSRVLDIVANGLSVERYRKLLLELYHVVWHFNPVCAAAACRITDAHKAVRYYLYEHMNEEKGHEEWVMNDLAVVGVDAQHTLAYEPSEFILAFVGYNYWAADRRHPLSALGMVYTLEVIASVYGGPMTAAIKESLLLEGDRGISFISSHAELDALHMAELRVVLNGVNDDDAKNAIVESACVNFSQFGRVLEAI